ncbi:helicase-related protein [Tepidibacillus infernus]|uniref:helicase-related protein n=1 Tax=Tepidibacillus infernus TaxID=1806172 RepID=UPI003B6A4240
MELYIDFRNRLLEEIEKELVGPGSEEISGEINNEILTEDPLKRYTVGILYPKESKLDVKEEINYTGEAYISESDEDELLDSHITAANLYSPSALGFSFYISLDNPVLKIKTSTAKYRKVEVNECKINFKDNFISIENNKISNFVTLEDNYLKFRNDRLIDLDKFRNLINEINDNDLVKKYLYTLFYQGKNGYLRIPVEPDQMTIDLRDLNKNIDTIPIEDGLNLVIRRKEEKELNRSLVTVVLINNNEGSSNQTLKCYFQSKIEVRSKGIIPYHEKELDLKDDEEESLEMLYKDKKSYAIGHGCSVIWDNSDSEIILNSTYLPIYEVPQMDFDLDDRLDEDDKSILSMKNLSDLSEFDKKQIIEKLIGFKNKYAAWIHSLDKEVAELPDQYLEVSHRHIKQIKVTLERIESGIDLLKNNDEVFKAFQLANRAMYMQRIHTDQKMFSLRYPEEGEITFPDYKCIDYKASWRPFQLGFLLLTLESIVDPNSKDREVVDLIWFPTGGGKTEAYLGVTAFTIFHRRLTKTNNSGVTVIMRYTLRLLTAQQFERASTLILACELIRQENPKLLGKDKISIGLWIGSASTPNSLVEADNKLKELEKNIYAENPFQVLSCPWCKTSLIKEKNKPTSRLGYRISNLRRKKRFVILCTEPACPFHDELPIRVVDEDIYNEPPTLLFSTVDKFANLPWNENVSSIFAVDSKNTAPELIIQDELHLISGPLGTLVGLYETAIDMLCSHKGVKPKIISSTATIRKAKEQIKNLYNRDVQIFPPQGVVADDSFFARVSETKLGRLYVGIMSSGKTQTTTEIRLLASLLQSVERLDFDNEIKDKFWTLLAYFNSIRELGKAKTLIQDDVKDHIGRIFRRKQDQKIRKVSNSKELTSRIPSDKIPKILEQLNITLSNIEKKTIDVLLASNMISVGIDVSRLGLMVIVGQPKTTSEYIQASSRVGRTYPGIIFSLYDGARPRDRSHFEHFVFYHQSFYKFVEPTSVTPFSEPSVQRGIHALLISLVRHLTDLKDNNDAARFDKNMPELEKIKDFILKRVEEIDKQEYQTVKEYLKEIVNDWDKIRQENDLVYYTDKTNKQSLMYTYGEERLFNQHYATLRSLRNVDSEAHIEVIEDENN